MARQGLDANGKPPSTIVPRPAGHGSGQINMTFTDGSARPVGLNELWTLTWHRGCSAGGPWTKAGGVRPEDWPAWMRRFKDY